jgi:hypothetical protein
MLDPFTRRRVEKIMDQYIKHKNTRRYIQQRKLKYRILEDTVTLLEERPVFLYGEWMELGIAQFRLADQRWSIYWRDRYNNWHFLDNVEPDANFEKQLKMVELDQNGIFRP